MNSNESIKRKQKPHKEGKEQKIMTTEQIQSSLNQVSRLPGGNQVREPQIGLKDRTYTAPRSGRPITPHTPDFHPGNFVPDGNAETLQGFLEDPPIWGIIHQGWQPRRHNPHTWTFALGARCSKAIAIDKLSMRALPAAPPGSASKCSKCSNRTSTSGLPRWHGCVTPAVIPGATPHCESHVATLKF